MNVDPDHGPLGNHEAALLREIAALREKLKIAKKAQEQIWQANANLTRLLSEQSLALEVLNKWGALIIDASKDETEDGSRPEDDTPEQWEIGGYFFPTATHTISQAAVAFAHAMNGKTGVLNKTRDRPTVIADARAFIRQLATDDIDPEVIHDDLADLSNYIDDFMRPSTPPPSADRGSAEGAKGEDR